MTAGRAPLALGLASVLAAGVWAGVRLFAPEITLDGDSGDWRAVSEGLRRSGNDDSLAGGSRAVVHVHPLGVARAEISLRVSARDSSVPVRLTVSTSERIVFEGALPPGPLPITVPVADDVVTADVRLQAAADVESHRPLYRIQEVTLRRSFAPWAWLGRALPGLVGIATFLCLIRRQRLVTILLWSLLAVLAAAGLCATLADPPAWLLFRPATRERLRMVGLAGLWALALARPPSRGVALAALWGTVCLVHLPTLGYGLVSDELLWARPWSAGEVLSTFWGSADPSGWTGAPYRPIPSLGRAADYWLWGMNVQGHHITNLLVFALDGTLAWLLLSRLGLSARTALFGALVWLAHPLTATAACWTGQRTDSLMAVFYLGALLAWLAPGFGRRHAAAAVACTVLSLACKEMAVSLPVAGYLVVRAVLPAEERRRRHRTLAIAALTVLAYGCVWVTMFTTKLVSHGGRWRGFDPTRLEDWARLPPMLLGALYLPTGYEDFSVTRFRDWSLVYLSAAIAVPLLAGVMLLRCGPCRSARPLLYLGFLWPVVTVLPTLGVRPDLYRLGLLPSLGAATVIAVLVQHLEHRASGMPALAGAGLVVWLAPLSMATAAAWGPGGFLWSDAMTWARQAPEFVGSLHPDTQKLFWRQLDQREHAVAWVAGGSP